MREVVSNDVRAAAHALIDGLPPDATWDDIMYQVYVRQEIEAGLRDAEDGRVVDQDEAERRIGLA